jgi:hypothetical protein
LARFAAVSPTAVRAALSPLQHAAQRNTFQSSGRREYREMCSPLSVLPRSRSGVLRLTACDRFRIETALRRQPQRTRQHRLHPDGLFVVRRCADRRRAGSLDFRWLARSTRARHALFTI